MSDAEHNPTRKDNGQPAPVLEVVVRFDLGTHNVSVHADGIQAGLCYGILCAATEMVRRLVGAQVEQQGPRILPATLIPRRPV